MRLGCFYGAPHKIADHYKRHCFRLGSSIRLRLIGELRALAGWAFYCRAIRSPGRIQVLATDHVRLSSCEFPSSGDQHVRALDVRLRCRTSYWVATLPDALFCFLAFFERDSVTSRLNDDIGGNLSDRRRVGRDLRNSAGLRHAFSAPHRCLVDSADSDG